MKDYYLNDHPLSSSFSMEDEWVTKVGKVKIHLPKETRKGLIQFIAQKAYSADSEPKFPWKPYTDKHFYNMFEFSSTNNYIADFEKYTNELVRYYIANAWNVQDVENMAIKSKAFGNIQTYGQRTYPHYHHGYDGVFVHYLTLGNEFSIDKYFRPIDYNADEGVSLVQHDDIRASTEHRAPTTHSKIFEQQGNLLLQDPRPSISYPFNRKAIPVIPEVGLTVFHPGYVWHESNPFTEGGIRALIVVKFSIIPEGPQDTNLN